MSQDFKDYIIIGMAILFGLLFVVFVAYAMVSSDAYILKKAFWLLSSGLAVVLGWAFDTKKLLQYFMKSSNDENHQS